MKTALSIAQIVEAIKSLPSEEQAVLFEQLDPKKQKKQSSLLNVPPTLLNNPLLDEVSEQIEAYRRQRNAENQPDRLIWAYQGLGDIIKYLTRFQIFDFSLDAYNLFRELRQQKIRIGTQDLRIAAIVLSQNYILLTRNQKDFSQVPNLQIEDWTCK